MLWKVILLHAGQSNLPENLLLTLLDLFIPVCVCFFSDCNRFFTTMIFSICRVNRYIYILHLLLSHTKLINNISTLRKKAHINIHSFSCFCLSSQIHWDFHENVIEKNLLPFGFLFHTCKKFPFWSINLKGHTMFHVLIKYLVMRVHLFIISRYP